MNLSEPYVRGNNDCWIVINATYHGMIATPETLFANYFSEMQFTEDQVDTKLDSDYLHDGTGDNMGDGKPVSQFPHHQLLMALMPKLLYPIFCSNQILQHNRTPLPKLISILKDWKDASDHTTNSQRETTR